MEVEFNLGNLPGVEGNNVPTPPPAWNPSNPADLEKIQKLLAEPRTAPQTELPEKQAKQVQSQLQELFLTGEPNENLKRVQEFKTLLRETGAIIAGGFCLSAFGLKRQGDIDIQVNCKNLPQVTDWITSTFNFTPTNEQQASLQCESFLRRNGIRSVTTWKQPLDIEAPDQHQIDIQVMGVRNKNTPLDVAQNFDLTCCQVWQDGEKVYATHPSHALNKVAQLQKEQIPLQIQGNRFLRERLNRYKQSGFQIQLEPSPLPTMPLGERIQKCFAPIQREAQIQRWAKSTLLNFIVTNTSTVRSRRGTSVPWPLYTIMKTNTQSRVNKTTIRGQKNEEESFLTSDGQDSDDYESVDSLKAVAAKQATKYYPELAPLDDEMKLYQVARRLVSLFQSANPKKNPQLQDVDNYLPDQETIDMSFWNIADIKPPLEFAYPQISYLNQVTTRQGEDFATIEEGPVQDFHAHPREAGISQESLEQYLDSHKGDKDKDTVPCYWAGSGCTKPLTLDEIAPCVSPEFFAKQRDGGKLPEQIEIMNSINATAFQVLENVKTSTDGWGELQHHSICPFCLVSEERNAGCSQMVHENKKGLPNSAAPWCNPKAVIPEMIEKQKGWVEAISAEDEAEGSQTKLEFCVECGRPSNGHKHFSADEPPRYVMAIREEGEPADVQQTKCAGGGRPELFARILAMRQAVRDQKGDDVAEMRRLAAFAADAAPLNAELMERAKAIFALPPAERQWNNREAMNRWKGEKAAAAVQQANNMNSSNMSLNENIGPIPNNEGMNEILQENALNQEGGMVLPSCPYCEKNVKHAKKHYQKTRRQRRKAAKV